MAIDVATFKASFPEFAAAPNTLVESQLDYAEVRCPLDVWGDLREEGIFIYCARFLAQSPYARKMGMTGFKEGRTPYDDRLAQLIRTVASGFRVL